MIYLLIVNVSLIISLLLYRLIFRKLTFFRWNRIYLMGMLVFSVLAPIGIFIELPTTEIVDYGIPTVDLSTYMNMTIHNSEDHPIYLINVLTYVYWSGAVIAGALLLFRAMLLFRTLRLKPAYLSFSFFNKIIIGQSIKDKVGIELHERVHVALGHSYDLVLLELFKIFNWFNPFLYLFQKELKFQHECIADEICSTDKVAYAEMLVAHAMQVDELVFTHEFSNQSLLKKRIMMLFKHKSARKHKFLYVTILPILCVVVGSTLVFNTSRAREMVTGLQSDLSNVQLSMPDAAERILDEHNEDRGIDHDKIYSHPDVKPVPFHGMEHYAKGLSEKIKISAEAIERGVLGVITIAAIVEKDGKLSHVKAKNDLGYQTASAVEKAVQMNGKWKPALSAGKPVRSMITLPVNIGAKTTYYWDENDDANRPIHMSSDVFPTDEVKKSMKSTDTVTAFKQVDVAPEPVGGMKSFMSWVSSNFKFPKAALENGVNGILEISFVVEMDGSLSGFRISRDLGYGTGESALELIKRAEKWNPGIQDGRKVRVAYTLPIRLNLTTLQDKPEKKAQ